MSFSDLLNLFSLLNEAKVPTILVMGGTLFLFVAIGGQFGAIVQTNRVKPIFAASIGFLFLFCGATLYMTPLFAVNSEPSSDNEDTKGVAPVTIRVTEDVIPEINQAPTATAMPGPTALPPTIQLPTNTSSPSATPQLLPPTSIERVQFCSGCTSSTTAINLDQNVSKGYALRIFVGQTLYVSTDRYAIVKILDDTGTTLTPILSDNNRWEVVIPYTGDYQVVVGGNGRYELTFEIPPIGNN